MLPTCCDFFVHEDLQKQNKKTTETDHNGVEQKPAELIQTHAVRESRWMIVYFTSTIRPFFQNQIHHVLRVEFVDCLGDLTGPLGVLGQRESEAC